MPFHAPIRRADQLPSLGSDIERDVTDWKAPGQATDKKQTAFHKAKDVAAFANHLGGALVVGACEGRDGKLAKWEGMTRAEANNLAAEYSRSIDQKCDPPMPMEPVPIPCPGDDSKVVLVVNVPASVRLIGVKADVAPHEGWNDKNKAFVYPMRTGTTTRFLSASEFPMFMTPEVRRVAIMLSRIPPETRVKVSYTSSREPMLSFIHVDEEQNLVVFRDAEGTGDWTIPLDCIDTVYLAVGQGVGHRDEWRIVPNSIMQRL